MTLEVQECFQRAVHGYMLWRRDRAWTKMGSQQAASHRDGGTVQPQAFAAAKVSASILETTTQQ